VTSFVTPQKLNNVIIITAGALVRIIRSLTIFGFLWFDTGGKVGMSLLGLSPILFLKRGLGSFCSTRFLVRVEPNLLKGGITSTDESFPSGGDSIFFWQLPLASHELQHDSNVFFSKLTILDFFTVIVNE
jgi:hypothetical protein